MRKLQGVLLQPKIKEMSTKPKGGSITVSCKVSVILVTLVKKRMELSAGGDADAEIEATELPEDMKEEIESAVLEASAGAAMEDVLQYLARRDNP